MKNKQPYVTGTLIKVHSLNIYKFKFKGYAS